MNLFLVYLQKSILEFKYYKISLMSFFLIPIFSVIKWYLTGEFVKEIIFYNKPIKYFYFLVFSTIISDIFVKSYIILIRSFYRTEDLYEFLLQGLPRVFIYKTIIRIFEVFLSNLPVFILVLFFFSLNVKVFLISIFLSIFLVIPGISLSLIVSPLLLYFKGTEAMVVSRILFKVKNILVPVMFSFYLFPYYKTLAILIPTIGIVEELRRYLFTGNMDIIIFLLAILSSIGYLIIGVFIFMRAFNHARKQGWIGLR